MTRGQSRRMSLLEAVTNIVLGYAVAIAVQLLVFPLFDLRPAIHEHLLIGAVFTAASLARGYTLRRLFNALRSRS